MSFNKLVFDTTDAESIADSSHVGSHTLSGVGALITSGDGNSDDLVNTAIEGLDVRSFQYGYDVTGGNWDRVHATAGAMNVHIASGSFELDVVILAEKAEDSAHTTGDVGNYVLGVRLDDIAGANSALLAGTNGDYQGFFTNAKGEMYVKDTDSAALLTTIDGSLTSILADTTSISNTLGGLSHAEDSAHTTGDAGQFGLTIRADDINGANSALLAGTNGDYQGMLTDIKGQLYVTMKDTITTSDAAQANTDIKHTQKSIAVDNTAESAVAALDVLASRKYLYLANSGNKNMYIGGTGVNNTTGFPICPGSYIELRAGAAVDVQISGKATGSDLRVLQLS